MMKVPTVTIVSDPQEAQLEQVGVHRGVEHPAVQKGKIEHKLLRRNGNKTST